MIHRRPRRACGGHGIAGHGVKNVEGQSEGSSSRVGLTPIPRFGNAAWAYPAPNLRGLVNNFVSNVVALNHDHEGDARLDYQLDAKDSVFVRGSGDGKTSSRDRSSPRPGTAATTSASTRFCRPVQAWSVIGNWTRTLSPTLVNEFRTGFTRLDSNQLALESAALFLAVRHKGHSGFSRIDRASADYGERVRGSRIANLCA